MFSPTQTGDSQYNKDKLFCHNNVLVVANVYYNIVQCATFFMPMLYLHNVIVVKGASTML